MKENIFCIAKEKIFSLSAFIFFSLTLALPSGYSYGAIVCLIAALIAFDIKSINRIGFLFCIYFLLLGIFFSTGDYGFFSLNKDLEVFWKYSACGFLGLFLIGRPISIKYIIYGMCLGAVICIAISYVQYSNYGRVHGFTNAIRYGNISMLIAFWLFLFGFLNCLSKQEKILVFLCSFLSMSSSILSLSRGGWVLIPIAFLFLIAFAFKGLISKKYICGFVFLFLCAFFLGNGIQRISTAFLEVNGFLSESNGSATTSVGTRLEMYKYALDIIPEKPFLGWGKFGERKELANRVAKGDYDDYLVTLPHLHNEFLDTVARKGVVGGLLLLFIYVAPIVFLLTQGGIFNINEFNQKKTIAIAIVILPISYFLFGLSDLFFHINISHLFYSFSTLFLLSAYVNLEKDLS